MEVNDDQLHASVSLSPGWEPAPAPVRTRWRREGILAPAGNWTAVVHPVS